jgi:small conductance mechanosensitive channel
VIVVLAAAFSEASSLLLTRALGRYARDRARGRRAGQLRTLAPLLRGLIHGVVWVLAVLTVLSEWGLKVGPLLAGAGVVGIAVGFGAQTLVKDLLTGFFLVLEDIVAVGDTVRIGDSSGQVEAMTLRTIRLRDTDGALHVFPYGEAQVIHNSTASFSYAVFDLSVGYGADVDRALALMADTGAALRADPAFAPKILEPFEVMGVERLSETAVVLKGRVKTCPGDQGAVAREYHRRIKLAFDAACVPAPWPQASLFRPDGAPAH